MTAKSQQSITVHSFARRQSVAKEARKEADRLACDAWNKRMLRAFPGPAQPSPTLGNALNAGYLYLEVLCLGCDTKRADRWLGLPGSSLAAICCSDNR